MKRSKFNLSHYKLTSCNQGELIPIGMVEVLPGDTIQQATSALIRVSPLLAPVMHPVHVRIHHWFVPFRLIWDDWEDFITGGADGLNNSSFPVKNFAVAVAESTLADYLGVTPGFTGNVSALPFRAYNLIFNEWYRDADLMTEVPISTASGTDATTEVNLRKVAWEKDYFTKARPWAQKGSAVTVPIGTVAPIVTTGVKSQAHTSADLNPRDVEVTGAAAVVLTGYAGSQQDLIWDSVGLQADLGNATKANISELRTAFALMRFEEARARYGSRYTEYLRYLGVRSSDARLQRPEYLGGGKQTIQFSEVLQTGVTTSGTPNVGVGDLKGHGIGSMRSNRYRRYFEEHGFVMTVMSTKPKTCYADGLHRMLNRRTKTDFWQKELEHIGQQAVLNKEVRSAHATPEGTFGYVDRYDDYRQMFSTVSGEFRSTLNHWHYARLFASDPTLNAAFVESSPTTRVYTSTTSDQLYIMAHHSIQARRLVAPVGNPI